MSLGVVLTIIFLVLKLVHTIDWSWWLVALPVIIEVVFDLILVFGTAITGASLLRRFRR